jgi:hypothetical protein
MMESFILFHEFGHILLGHLDDVNRDFAVRPSTFSKAFKKSREREFQADAFAAIACTKQFSKEKKFSETHFYGDVREHFKNPEKHKDRIERAIGDGGLSGSCLIAYGAIIELFNIFDLLEFTAKRLGLPVARTHPPAKQRLVRVQKILEEDLTSNGLDPKFLSNHIKYSEDSVNNLKRGIRHMIKEKLH